MKKAFKSHSDIFKNILLILLAVAVVYANTLSNSILNYDDYSNIIDHPLIKDLSRSFMTFQPKNVVFALIYKVFGFNAAVFHLHSLIFHFINSVLVYLIARILFSKQKEKEKLALLTSLLFSLNPVTGETVNWITGSVYLYVALFSLLTILFFIKYRNENVRKYLIISLAVYIVSVLSQRTPWILPVPLVILALDYFHFGKYRPREYKDFLPVSGFFLAAIIYALVFLPGQVNNRLNNLAVENVNADTPPRIILIGKNIKEALASIVFPFNVSVVHNAVNSSFILYLIFLAMPILLLIIFRKLYKWDKFLAMLFAAYFASLAPLFSPIHIAVNYAERYFYLAMVFPSIGYVYVANKVMSKYKNPSFIWAVLSMVIIIFGIRSFIRTFDYRNDYTLWSQAAVVAPTNYKPHMELGVIAHKEDRVRDALAHYDTALKLNDNDPLLHYDIGLTYLKSGRTELAEIFFLQSLKINPQFTEAYYRLAQLHVLRNDNSAAIELFNKALSLNPGFEPARLELAKISQ